jgi:glycosyltransferase involved in cell wall biosynthesis/murein DD-endopeptidase MepM/ murein hydrolase activator NlpD
MSTYLFLSPTLRATGNNSTISRIASFFPGSTVLDSHSSTPETLLAVVAAQSPRALVFLHALHSGRLLASLSDSERAHLPPSILILGGTDVAADVLSEADSAPFSAAASAARFVVAFSADLGERFLRTAASARVRAPPVRVIAQSVESVQTIADTQRAVNLLANADPRAALNLPASARLIIFAGGLRPVKDPLFILRAWAAWIAQLDAARELPDATRDGSALQLPTLLLVGPTLDEDLGAALSLSASESPNIIVRGPVDRETLLSWFSAADAVINTSQSEGQSNTLLEAMSVGTPVIARNVDGNASLISHGVNGLLFDSADEAIGMIARVCGLPFNGVPTGALQAINAICAIPDASAATSPSRARTPLGARIAKAAILSISAHHSVAAERSAWDSLFSSIDAAVRPAGQTPTTAYVPWPFLALSTEQRAASRDTADALAWLGAIAPFSPVVDTAAVLVGVPSSVASMRYWGRASALEGVDADFLRWPVPPRVFDLSSSSAGEAEGAPGWGRYGEFRGIYSSSEHFAGTVAPRTLHLGVDLGVAELTPVSSPLAGRVHSVGRDTAPLGYGPTVILAHAIELVRADGSRSCIRFYTLYGHLSAESVFGGDGAPRAGLARGNRITAGEPFAAVGGRAENGGWFAHLHFQIVTELNFGGWAGDYPGVARAADEAAYRVLVPDANLLLRCPWVRPQGWDPNGPVSITSAAVVDAGEESVSAA